LKMTPVVSTANCVARGGKESTSSSSTRVG
jgi:hypothetical protein